MLIHVHGVTKSRDLIFKMRVNLWFKSSVPTFYVTSASDINLFSNILDFPAKIWVGMGGEFCATPASDINLSSEIFPIPLKGSFPLCQPKQRPHRQQNKTMLMLMHFGKRLLVLRVCFCYLKVSMKVCCS